MKWHVSPLSNKVGFLFISSLFILLFYFFTIWYRNLNTLFWTSVDKFCPVHNLCCRQMVLLFMLWFWRLQPKAKIKEESHSVRQPLLPCLLPAWAHSALLFTRPAACGVLTPTLALRLVGLHWSHPFFSLPEWPLFWILCSSFFAFFIVLHILLSFTGF